MTSLPGPTFYDDETVFTTYWASRERPDNPNDTLEQPTLHELIGELKGQRILDLGCGDATFGRHVLTHGARSYVGVEASHNMVAAARETLVGTPGHVDQAAMETWPFPEMAFDLAVSSLALHYVGELDAVFAGVHRALVTGGRFIFSVEHPIITSCARGWHETRRQDWIVDDYFVIGPRETSWLGGEVIRYHRTVEAYVAALLAAGFVLDRLRESHPQRERFTDEAEYERRMRIPLFLFLAAHRTDSN